MKRQLSTGSRIKAARLQNGFTQSKLAKELHIAPNTLSDWENDKIVIPSDRLKELAEITKVSTDSILGIKRRNKRPSIKAQATETFCILNKIKAEYGKHITS